MTGGAVCIETPRMMVRSFAPEDAAGPRGISARPSALLFRGAVLACRPSSASGWGMVYRSISFHLSQSISSVFSSSGAR